MTFYLSAFSEDTECKGENQFYNKCGTKCPLTCTYPKPRVCVKMCNPGCACKDGYIWKNNNKCVRPEEC